MVDNAICGQELTQSFTKSCHAIWVDMFYHEKLSWATTTTKWQILGWTCHKQEMQDKEKHSESAILVLPLLEFSCMTPQCPSQEYWVLTGAKLCKLCYIIHHQLFVNYIIQLQCKNMYWNLILKFELRKSFIYSVKLLHIQWAILYMEGEIIIKGKRKILKVG